MNDLLNITFAAMTVFGALALYADHAHTQSRKISKIMGFARALNITLCVVFSGISFALIAIN